MRLLRAAAQSESEAELAAMLVRAAKSIDLEVPKAPSPECSQLDWFLGAGSDVPPLSTPVPFFPEVHEELTKTWRAPYTAHLRLSTSLLTTLDGEVARGYVDVPQVERAVAVHLCPQNAATWRNCPRLPSKACKLSSALAAKAYSTEGQAASALHAMAIHQAKALKKLHQLVSGRDMVDLTGLPQAPSTRQAYALKWRGGCSVGVVFFFLQEKLERRLSPSTLKVYVAAITAYHDVVDGLSLGKHHLIIRFLRGARRLNPPRLHLIPSWDLSVVFGAEISLKTVLLIALTSIKRVGDLHAFSVSETCLEFGPADSHMTLRPRPGYVSKVPTTPFRDQVVNLQALPPEEADPASALLCPVCALRTYMDRTRSFRRSEQVIVCFGGQQKGNGVSKQRLAHWAFDAITMAYQCQGEPCPLGVRAHSTRSADICRAAGWATPNTFTRFHNLCIEPVSSRVL
ncbi:hypothetical protein M9458_008168, partial [Cirrhinus mrigala]